MGRIARMRVTRFLMMVLAVAFAAAGCAQQPITPLQVASAAPPPSIDNMVYGPAAASAPAPLPSEQAAAARGLFMTASLPPRSGTPAPVVTAATLPQGTAATGSIAHPPALNEGPYTLDSGDRLRIVVFGQEGLTNSYAVDASGHIAMPLIGSVLARGATTDELSSRIADKLRQGFIREPHVAVEIEAYRPFFILGEVTQPGQYPYVADMTAETAVAIAGGFTPRAFRRTVTLNRIVSGQQVRMTVPVTYPLRPGDTINVQERWF